MRNRLGIKPMSISLLVACCFICALFVSESSRPVSGSPRLSATSQVLFSTRTLDQQPESTHVGTGMIPMDHIDTSSTELVDPWALGLYAHGGGSVQAVEVVSGYALTGVGPRLVVFDTSSPIEPKIIWQSPVLPGGIVDVTISGTYAAVAYSNHKRDSGLVVYDISDVRNIFELAHFVISESGMV